MNQKNKNILLGVLIVGVLSMTVAFAALSTRLNIGGTTQVASTTWNIHFANWQPATDDTVTVGTNTQGNTAIYPTVAELQQTIDVANSTKVDGLNVTLRQPNDYAKYTFEIVNDGTIDASLQNFTHGMTCSNNKDCSFLDYEVKCYEASSRTGTEVTTNSVLTAGRRAYCYLQVKYKDVNNQNQNNAGSNQVYTQEEVSASLSANWIWVQRQNSVQTGGNTPVTPAGNYTYYIADPNSGSNLISTTTFDSSWKAYIRQGTNGNYETCGVYPSGTVCMTSSYYNSNYSSVGNYNADFADVSESTDNITTVPGLQATGLKGYSLSKAEEMLSKGASSCGVHSDYVICNIPSGGYCDIYYYGEVYCYDDSHHFNVDSDGSIK